MLRNTKRRQAGALQILLHRFRQLWRIDGYRALQTLASDVVDPNQRPGNSGYFNILNLRADDVSERNAFHGSTRDLINEKPRSGLCG